MARDKQEHISQDKSNQEMPAVYTKPSLISYGTLEELTQMPGKGKGKDKGPKGSKGGTGGDGGGKPRTRLTGGGPGGL